MKFLKEKGKSPDFSKAFQECCDQIVYESVYTHKGAHETDVVISERADATRGTLVRETYDARAGKCKMVVLVRHMGDHAHFFGRRIPLSELRTAILEGIARGESDGEFTRFEIEARPETMGRSSITLAAGIEAAGLLEDSEVAVKAAQATLAPGGLAIEVAGQGTFAKTEAVDRLEGRRLHCARPASQRDLGLWGPDPAPSAPSSASACSKPLRITFSIPSFPRLRPVSKSACFSTS